MKIIIFIILLAFTASFLPALKRGRTSKKDNKKLFGIALFIHKILNRKGWK